MTSRFDRYQARPEPELGEGSSARATRLIPGRLPR